MNGTRVFWCVIYGLLGVVALIAFGVKECPILQELLKKNITNIFWCTGWAGVGIGLGLWNSRDGGSAAHLHYVTYFFFVWFIASLAAFTASSLSTDLRSYTASALAGIAVGFAGDSLAGLILKLGSWK